MLCMLIGAVANASQDRSLRYFDLLAGDAAGHVAEARYLTETERGHMTEYLAGAGPELTVRFLEVTQRLGCKNGPVAAEQQNYRWHIFVEIYAAHVRQALHRFELLYGDRADRVLAGLPGRASGTAPDMTTIVQTNLAACGGMPELQTAHSD